MFVILHKAATFFVLIFTKSEIVMQGLPVQNVIKINCVILELPDDKKKKIIIDYCLKGVGWMAKVSPLKHFYALITKLSP